MSFVFIHACKFVLVGADNSLTVHAYISEYLHVRTSNRLWSRFIFHFFNTILQCQGQKVSRDRDARGKQMSTSILLLLLDRFKDVNSFINYFLFVFLLTRNGHSLMSAEIVMI